MLTITYVLSLDMVLYNYTAVSTDTMMGIETSHTIVPSMTTVAIKTSHIIMTPPNTSTGTC